MTPTPATGPRTAAEGARPATDAGRELVRRTYGMKVRPREQFEAFVDLILAIEAEASGQAAGLRAALQAWDEWWEQGADPDAAYTLAVAGRAAIAAAYRQPEQGEPGA